MGADVTLHITVGSGQAAITQDTGSQDTGSAIVAAAASPIPLEQLQVGAAGEAPAPLSLEQLTTVGTTTVAGEAPAPMPIEQLLGKASVAAAAPEPIDTLMAAGGPAAPRPLEQLGAAMTAPEPLPLDELGEPEQEQKESPPARKR